MHVHPTPMLFFLITLNLTMELLDAFKFTIHRILCTYDQNRMLTWRMLPFSLFKMFAIVGVILNWRSHIKLFRMGKYLTWVILCVVFKMSLRNINVLNIDWIIYWLKWYTITSYRLTQNISSFWEIFVNGFFIFYIVEILLFILQISWSMTKFVPNFLLLQILFW